MNSPRLFRNHNHEIYEFINDLVEGYIQSIRKKENKHKRYPQNVNKIIILVDNFVDTLLFCQ